VGGTLIVTGAANTMPFERFLDGHAELVMRYLAVAVGPADAEDVFQETFLAALRAWPEVVDDGRLERWILRIASRKALDHHRRRRVRPTPVEAVPDRAVSDEPRDHALWGAVAGLPEAQREAVIHRFAFDRTYAQIADAAGCTPEAARANVYQGMKKLREAMG
jgi:RNA polymerase sigma factor (sigma-70 family)